MGSEELVTISSEFAESVVNTVREPLIVLDQDLRVVTVSRSFYDFFQVQPEETVGQLIYDLGNKQWDIPKLRELLDTILPEQTSFDNYEVEHDFATIGRRTMLLNGRQIEQEGVKKRIILLAIEDITKRKAIEAGLEMTRKELQAQLLHSHKMEAVGTLAGGIAHDFNNILNVIMGYGDMVMDSLAIDSPVREDMSEVLVAAHRAAELTKRLLAFSRKEVTNVTPVNINDIILGLKKMLVRIIKENIEFQVDLTDTPLLVLADGGQIEQVLTNLAANAKDVMPEGGRLLITTSIEEIDEEYVAAYGYGRPGRYALITVADTGQGMDAETQQKIFEPFFTTKSVGKGTGLGLAISYGIIKQHNGYIKVYSEPSEGTVFKIYLPLCDEAALDKKPEDTGVVMGGDETVLVAEDDAALRELSRRVLEAFGYTIITAEDGEEAITKFLENREQINLILLDMIMPKKNGKEVSAAIRQVSPKMKILFASGYPLETITNKEELESGFDFIQKPYQSKGLLLKVREVLDK
ncbi:MAG: ATP-binding protein [Desulfobulbaceae bacterium]|nr:ATP-binding protein [Desulfobulbaceae bacterium]